MIAMAQPTKQALLLEEEAARDRFARNGYHDMEPWDFEAMGE